MGKYADALGIWEHKLGNIEHRIKPRVGDNYKLTKLLSDARSKNDMGLMMEKVGDFYFDLIIRDYPELTETERGELKVWVEMNVMQIMKDMMIAFKWTTAEQLAKSEGEGSDAAKKLMFAV